MMNRSPSDSSLDGDDSTVSSKSNRIRPLGSPNGDSNGSAQGHPEAQFSDMPSLASYRGDEISLASTLWTDCDQSLPSLSSYRTRDLSVSGSCHSKSRSMRSRAVSESDVEEDSEADDTTEDPTKPSSQQSGILKVRDTPSKPPSQQAEPDSTFPLNEVRGPISSSSSQIENGGGAGDCLPRLPRRLGMDDSGHREDSDEESCSEASDISDDSPDVSIDTDEEHDDPIDPAHDPVHLTPPHINKPTAMIDTYSPPKSPSPITTENGNKPSFKSLETESTAPTSERSETHNNTAPAKRSPNRSRNPINPPAEITTPPGLLEDKKTTSTRRSQDGGEKDPDDKKSASLNAQKLSSVQKSKKIPVLEPLTGSQTGSPDNNSDLPYRVRRRVRRHSADKRGEKDRKAPPRATSETGVRMFLSRGKSRERRRGVGRTKSDMAQFAQPRGDGVHRDGEQKRGLVRRLSSSLSNMTKPMRSRSGNLFKTKLKRKAKKTDKQKRDGESSVQV